MKIKSSYFGFFVILLVLLTTDVYAVGETELTPAMENPGNEEKPDWFKVSFLDLHEDIDEATENNKRLMLFFFQDGCPYCKKLLEDNFGQRHIAEKTQKYFDVVAINIWGDREVTVGDSVVSEKEFSAALKVQYTPTLIYFNEKRKPVFRANGYYSPEKFDVVLDYVGKHKEVELTFQDYLAEVDPQPASGVLYKDIASISTPGDLSKALSKDRHLLVFFEQKKCAECDELHKEILSRPESINELKKLDTAFVDIWSNDKIVRPDGKTTTGRKWSKELGINYAPSLVYFNGEGEEVFRSDAYLRSFHIQSVMDYVSSGSYKSQKNFQRYIESRAEHLREQGVVVDLMD